MVKQKGVHALLTILVFSIGLIVANGDGGKAFADEA